MCLGPQLSPPQFDWVIHSTSEQAGQGMPGAWAMRAGFVAYGFAIAAASLLEWRPAPLARLALGGFGLGLIATAIWSNAPIEAGLPADMREDHFHSIASGVVGTAFAFACAARVFTPARRHIDWLALAGIFVAVAIPLGMVALPEIRGLLQRAIFVFSFAFVLREFAIAGSHHDRTP